MKLIISSTRSRALTALAGAALLTTGISCAEPVPEMLVSGMVPYTCSIQSENGVVEITYASGRDDASVVQTSAFINFADLAAVDEQIAPDQMPTPNRGQLNSSSVLVFDEMDEYDYYLGTKTFYWPFLIDSGLGVNAASGGEPTDPDGLRVNTNGIEIREAIVRFPSDIQVFGVDPGAFPCSDTETWVDAGNINSTVPILLTHLLPSTGSFLHGSIPILDEGMNFNCMADYIESLGGGPVTLVGEIQFRGQSLDGNDIESNIVQFPFTFCTDCNRETTRACVLE